MGDYKEFIKRLKDTKVTGVSIPFFGISWETGDSDNQIINRVISYLEDRRVLYLPYEPHMEKTHCIQSVLNIREYLSKEIEQLSLGSPIIPILKFLRGSCRKFIINIEPVQKELNNLPEEVPHQAKFVFSTSLGELRANFGIVIALLCAKYELDINENLAVIIPLNDCEDVPKIINTKDSGERLLDDYNNK